MRESGVEFASIRYTIADRTLLRDISLTLAPGTVTALLGRSGSGKTTLLRMVNALVMPTAGEVQVAGKPTTAWDTLELRRSIGYVIQETGLFPHWTVARNIGLALELAGTKTDAPQSPPASPTSSSSSASPPDLGTRYPWQLSGGQRQRVGLARALANDPAILLMDEPFGALDPITRAEMQSMVKDLFARVSKTVPKPSSSSPTTSTKPSSSPQRIIFLDAGNIMADLASSDVLASQIPYVQQYVAAVHRAPSHTRMNFLHLHAAEIGRLTFEHLWLTLFAILLAVAIGLPTGIWLTRHERWARPVIAVTNIIQVIPSLALFGLLLPVPGWAKTPPASPSSPSPATPCCPSCATPTPASARVDPALIDVARAMGMTSTQRLFKVELPLGASVILAGLRTATVTCVGVATIAAAIGAGGLGELIFRGVASVDNGLVLAGAIPAALLALIADAALGWLEGRLTVRRT